MTHARRTFAVLLLAVGLVGLQAPPPASAAGDEIIGIPTRGEAGFPRTVDELMQQQAISPSRVVPKDMEEELTPPDRTGLPQNPKSPALGNLPELPPGYQLESGGISPFSPQTVGTNFTGATLSGINPTLSFPPDCMGAVGPAQYVVFVNGRLVTFNKSTGLADGVLNADPDVFFASVNNTGSFTSDPRIRYDRLTGRWFLLIINTSTPNRILFAVSDAASAGTISGSTVFTFFFIDIASTPPAIASTCFADYPTLGIDNNALYIGTNNFCGSPSQTFNSCDGYVVRKSSIMGAGPIVVTVFRGLVASASAVGPYTPQGVDNSDPAANEGFFIGVDNATFGTLMMRRVATPGGTPTISANISITVPTTTYPVNVPHLGNTGGTNGRLSALDDRLFAAQFKNGRLWTAHNIQVNASGVGSTTGGRTGSRWYEFNVPAGAGTPTITQSGTVFDAAASNPTSYWIPSILISGQGHAALGMSNAGNNARANAATVGRLVGDALGTTQTPVLYTSSSTAYNPSSDPGGSGGRRWGDYSYTSLDPLDDMTMWTVQEFCDATNSYGVRIAKLIAPPPATPSSIADVTAGANPVNVTLTGLVVSGSGFYDPGANLPGVPAFNHLSAAITNGAATGTPPTVVSATYVNPTTVNLVLNASAATANVGAEKYTVTVTNPDGQSVGAAVLRVVGGSPVATIAAGPSQNELNSGTSAFNFTVNLSSAATAAVTINYATANGTATTADNDYVGATSSIIIPIGQSSGTIPVTVNGDTKFEPNETFTVTLTGATNATLGATLVSTGTILNDDTVPVASIGPVSQNEGNAGTTAFNFAVSLTNASSSAITINYQTADGTGTTADNDYAGAATFISIPAGSTGGTIAVNVNGDTKFEANETFTVTLTSGVNATIGVPAAGTGTIQNDDTAPTMTIDNVSLPEGNSGTTSFTFTVALSAVSGVTASASFATADGSATLAHNDYQQQNGTVTFAPGVVSQPITILVNGDTILEADETFAVDLTNLVGVQPGTPSGTGTIRNDDVTPALSVAAASGLEGDSGTSLMTFTVTLSNPTDQVVMVDYQTIDDSATIADSDYQATSGTLTFPAKTSSASLDVTIVGDTCREPDENFRVTLSNAVNATILVPTVAGTIRNDDDTVAPAVTVVFSNGGDSLEVGSSVNLQWTATDNNAVTTVDILLSRDGGATYPEVLATGLANSGTFAWIVTAPVTPGADAFLKVRAHDANCNTGEDVSDAGLYIVSPTSAVPTHGAVLDFALGNIRPNPTRGSTQIDFQLPREARVTVRVVDLQGREIARLVDGAFAAGRYQTTWNGQTERGPAANGVYFVHYEADGKGITQRLVLTR